MNSDPKLSDLANRVVCALWGHQWRTVLPREDEPTFAIFRPFKMCWRCGKLDR